MLFTVSGIHTRWNSQLMLAFLQHSRMYGGCIFSHSPWTPRLRSHGPAWSDHRWSDGLGGAIWMAQVSRRCACNEYMNGERLKTTSQRFPAIFPFTLRRSSLTSTVRVDGVHSCFTLTYYTQYTAMANRFTCKIAVFAALSSFCCFLFFLHFASLILIT